VTAINAYGETIPGPSASQAVTLNQQVTLDWADVTGATGYRVYRGTTSSNHLLIAETAASTYVDTGSAAIGGPPPSTNTTRSVQAYEAEAFARIITPAHLDLIFGYGVGFIVGVSQVGEEFL
jgi:hypothetical protein